MRDVIGHYRNKTINGITVDFVPLNEDHLADVVRLRNQEHVRYNMNQEEEVTLEGQKRWYGDYCRRDNDLYWCIVNKCGDVVGTVRLYDIDDSRCEHGSLIIDQKYTMSTPYALEAMVFSIDFAFNQLELDEVICNDRIDNTNMNSITKKIGFNYDGTVMIRGVQYNRYVLKKENSKTSKFNKILEKYASNDGDC